MSVAVQSGKADERINLASEIFESARQTCEHKQRHAFVSADYEHRNLHLRHALDELHLVCRYSEHALLADLAPETARFDFAAFALRVGRALADEHGVFNRVSLSRPK